jgi:hypothetical protein
MEEYQPIFGIIEALGAISGRKPKYKIGKIWVGFVPEWPIRGRTKFSTTVVRPLPDGSCVSRRQVIIGILPQRNA